MGTFVTFRTEPYYRVKLDHEASSIPVKNARISIRVVIDVLISLQK